MPTATSSQDSSVPSNPPVEELHFTRPSRRILSPEDQGLFLASPSYTLLVSFIFTLSDSIRDTPISAIKAAELDPAVSSVVTVLDDAEALIERCPPADTGGSRFGNKAFRDLVDAVEASLTQWHERLNITDPAAIDEVATYLHHSFGNRTRIDYGSGHELNFMIWLLCLNRLSILKSSTFPSLILVVLPRYLRLMRTIQMTYYLEPAGSHGVWGLDDYQFLPFLFGASQLLHHPVIRPLSIHQPLILEEYAKDYLYLDQVAFVNSVKNVEGLRWHSPMLDDISAAKSWEKVEAGMRRMFVAEVLGKLPVMQHFLFGSLVPAVEGMSTEEELGLEREEDEVAGGEVVVMQDGMKHVHTPNSWGD
ncbi:Serine/threonine-protein phosphatase 2A activator 2, partial [Cryomyces minteri]